MFSLTDLPERVRRRIEVTDAGWVWTGGLNDAGYGQISVGSRTDGSKRPERVHRLVWELLIGPIPSGLHVAHPDHDADPDCPGGRFCEHRRVVGPPGERTVLQTQAENKTAGARRRTHFRCGHELTKANTYVWPDGGRSCRTCRSRKRRAYRAEMGK